MLTQKLDRVHQDRSARLTILLTVKEKEMVSELAKRHGVPMSRLGRALLLAALQESPTR